MHIGAFKTKINRNLFCGLPHLDRPHWLRAGSVCWGINVAARSITPENKVGTHANWSKDNKHTRAVDM